MHASQTALSSQRILPLPSESWQLMGGNTAAVTSPTSAQQQMMAPQPAQTPTRGEPMSEDVLASFDPFAAPGGASNLQRFDSHNSNATRILMETAVPSALHEVVCFIRPRKGTAVSIRVLPRDIVKGRDDLVILSNDTYHVIE